MDGAGPSRFFCDMVLPLSRTNMAALFVILFVYGWNQYLWPLLVATVAELETVVIGMAKMIGVGDAQTEWNIVMATAVLAHAAAGAGGDADAALVRQRPDGDREIMATLDLLAACSKSFGATQVLHGIDLDVADGEMIVIVGASGCGKSTLLRIVAGLETPTAGAVRIDGRDVDRARARRPRHRHGVPELRALPAYDGLENMAYGLKIRGLPRPRSPRVARAAALLGIGPLLDRRPRQLSGGQRQRVAMGRAIVREPKLFLFDEPLSNLDAKLRVQMRAEIRRLQQPARRHLALRHA